MVIGIYGPWGSGKTTLMETVGNSLKNKEYDNAAVFRLCKTVWFQAWKYNEEEQILAGLIEEIFRTMKRDNFFEASKAEIEKLIKRFKPFKIMGKAMDTLTGFDPVELVGELAHKQKLGFYDTFQEFFDRLIWSYTRMRPKVDANEAPDDQKGVLVVFIDDLDRCPKDRIVRVLETIKLFMDKKGCVFVIGADNEIIETALADNFGTDGALRFMDKIVQVTFRLPHIPVIMPAIQHNPRRLKRFINNASLLEGLLRNSKMEMTSEHLLFWNLLDLAYSRLAREVMENPATLEVLRGHAQKLAKQNQGDERWDLSQEMLKEVPQSLQGYLQDKRLVDLVVQFDITREQLTSLITLSSIVITEEEKAGDERAWPTVSGDEMVLIPAGEFLYGEDRKPTTIETEFYMDIFPVTNSQFAAFVDNKGYERDDCWMPDGVKWRNQKEIAGPKFWTDEKWNKPDHPVVGVSWYEADAYARWAKKDLPTEIQWERAARGTDGRKYPWGDEFDKEKCNTIESKIQRTTRVNRYPNGVSPEGCYDMAGNVFEWTASNYNKDSYVLRGGCWDFNRDVARCADRFRGVPSARLDSFGFRCVRTK